MAAIEGEHVLQLSLEAQAVLLTWQTEVESMMRDGQALEDLKDWGSKLPGATVRFAAVMHCIEHGVNGEIGPQTMRQAIEIARYLIPHAESVLSMMQGKESTRDEEAKYLLRWIQRHKLEEFARRDAHQHGKRKFPTADDLIPAISELERRAYIRQKSTEQSGRGRPSSPLYEVNPEVLLNSPALSGSRNSPNSLSPSRNANFGNTGIGSRDDFAVRSKDPLHSDQCSV